LNQGEEEMANKKSSAWLRLTERDDEDDEDDVVGYLYLPNHSQNADPVSRGKTFKTIRLQDLYRYNGRPDIYLDFDEENRIIGIELA
jgi:hypothetical protein